MVTKTRSNTQDLANCFCTTPQRGNRLFKSKGLGTHVFCTTTDPGLVQSIQEKSSTNSILTILPYFIQFLMWFPVLLFTLLMKIKNTPETSRKEKACRYSS